MHVFQIVFEGTKIKNNGYRGDISIDDVTLRDGPCNPSRTTTSPLKSSLSTCTFQTADLCGFTQMKGTDKFDWTRDRAGTSSSQTGPSTDHSTGTSSGEFEEHQ